MPAGPLERESSARGQRGSGSVLGKLRVRGLRAACRQDERRALAFVQIGCTKNIDRRTFSMMNQSPVDLKGLAGSLLSNSQH
ncbi:hypothetical protein D3C87_1892440 [compost metagenome]